VRGADGWRARQGQAGTLLGAVDILINNADIDFDGRVAVDTTAVSLPQALVIDLLGVQNGLDTICAPMRERGSGHIADTASVMRVLPGRLGIPGIRVYSGSKAAVVAPSEALRGELASAGISVSVLCPALVKYRLAENTMKLGAEVQRNTSTKQGKVLR